MGNLSGEATTVLIILAACWIVEASRSLWLPKIARIARNRQSLYLAQDSARKAAQEAWEASWRNYEVCDPPAYIRKGEEGQPTYLGRRDW